MIFKRLILLLLLLAVVAPSGAAQLNRPFVDPYYNSKMAKELREKYLFALEKVQQCPDKKLQRLYKQYTADTQNPFKDLRNIFILKADAKQLETLITMTCAFVYINTKRAIFINIDNDRNGVFNNEAFNYGDYCGGQMAIEDTFFHEIMHLIGFEHSTEKETKEYDRIIEKCLYED